MTEDPRVPLLRKIVTYDGPIEPAMEALSKLPYDCDVDLVTIGLADLLSVIDRCIASELTVDQLAGWAEFLEIRDGVGFAPLHRDRLSEIVWELANPTINGEITRQRLIALRAELAGLAS